MRVVFFSNYLNIHQVFVADELYNMLGSEYAFVATMPVNETLLKGGVDFSQTKPYCVCAYKDEKQKRCAYQLAREAEVCVFGADSSEYAIERAKAVIREKSHKLSFEVCERWLKKGWINMASPRLIKWLINYHRYYKQAGFYRLCASAYCTTDDRKMRAYINRAFKWGYFIQNDSNPLINTIVETDNVVDNKVWEIMWCGRFLTWKHPEIPIELAALLKRDGIRFHIDMYGGEGMNIAYEKVYSRNRLEQLIAKRGVGEFVTLKGNRPNAEILQAMREHDIFLFTSDKKEGWGAVANEAMANGCVLVGSDEIGSVPYLVKDGVNGMIFRSGSVEDLYEKVSYLMTHREERLRMAQRAYEDMVNLWSPRNAAASLLRLAEALLNNTTIDIKEGPCSKA